MGFLKRLLTKDPAEVLREASEALESGDAGRALERLNRLPDDVPAELEERVADVEARAHAAACEAAIAKSRDLEEDDRPEDAIELLERAIGRCRGDSLRVRLEEELRRVEERLEASVAALEQVDEQEAVELDLEDNYAMLVGMLDDRIVEEHYQDRSEAFRRAHVDLHEGRAEAALPAFESLVEAHPDDAACRFERGHCLLVLGRPAEARVDLEAIWPAFGDGPLNDAGDLSVPLLWADALLELGEHEAIVERLAEQGQPANGEAALSNRLAVALVELGRLEEAVELLEACCKVFPREMSFSQLLAVVLQRRGERAGAIEVLERAIAPSCTGGSCGRQAMPLPSLRMLVGLYLDEGDDLPRVRELMQLVAGTLRGQLECVDHFMLARLHSQAGDESACAREIAQARRLLPAGVGELARAIEELEAKAGSA